jgi:hypothetical protein
VLLLVEALLRGLPVPRVLVALRRIRAAQHRRVQLEQVLEVPHREQVDPVRNERVDELVAGHHVGHCVVAHRVARRAQRVIDARKLLMHAPERRLDRVKIEPPTGSVSRGLVVKMRRGYWIRSSAARDCLATSTGRAM